MHGKSAMERSTAANVAATELQPQLFRRAAVTALSLHGEGRVLVAAPPCTPLAITLAILVLLLLTAALYFVEVPRRAPAVGVLMPPRGLVSIAAPLAARVTRLDVVAGDEVAAGQQLLRLSAAPTDGGGTSLPQAQLESLRREQDLDERVHRQRLELLGARRSDLDARRDAAGARIELAEQNVVTERARSALQRTRLARVRALEQRGLIAADTVDERHEALLVAKALLDARRRELLDARQALAALDAQRAQLREERRIETLEYEQRRERLQRQEQGLAAELARQIVAPRAARIAHIAVTEGSSVRAGELLLTLYRPDEALEAWLYVSTAHAARLRAGQRVELKLDAWPHRMFGTAAGVITAVSASALLPGQLSVPLDIRSPVFEVRARLELRTARGLARRGALVPGTSFRADLIRGRYRLYQWLGRQLHDAVDHGAA